MLSAYGRSREQRCENAPAEHRVRHDVLVFLGGQALGLVQHRLADADLADVVHVSAQLDLAKHVAVESHRAVRSTLE